MPDLFSTPTQATPACQQAVTMWNEMAERQGLPRVQVFTKTRHSKLRKRLDECGGLEGWRTAIAKVADSSFLTGHNDRNWRANFDFVLQESSFAKLIEGVYDDCRAPAPKQAPAHSSNFGRCERCGSSPVPRNTDGLCAGCADWLAAS